MNISNTNGKDSSVRSPPVTRLKSAIQKKTSTTQMQGASRKAQNKQNFLKDGPLTFSDKPMMLKCPCCHVLIETTIKYSVGSHSLAVALLVCAFGGWLFCCFVPLCLKKYKDVMHFCPKCKQKIGTHKKSKD